MAKTLWGTLKRGTKTSVNYVADPFRNPTMFREGIKELESKGKGGQLAATSSALLVSTLPLPQAQGARNEAKAQIAYAQKNPAKQFGAATPAFKAATSVTDAVLVPDTTGEAQLNFALSGLGFAGAGIKGAKAGVKGAEAALNNPGAYSAIRNATGSRIYGSVASHGDDGVQSLARLEAKRFSDEAASYARKNPKASPDEIFQAASRGSAKNADTALKSSDDFAVVGRNSDEALDAERAALANRNRNLTYAGRATAATTGVVIAGAVAYPFAQSLSSGSGARSGVEDYYPDTYYSTATNDDTPGLNADPYGGESGNYADRGYSTNPSLVVNPNPGEGGGGGYDGGGDLDPILEPGEEDETLPAGGISPAVFAVGGLVLAGAAAAYALRKKKSSKSPAPAAKPKGVAA